jgi:hypothetical protein
VRHRKVLLHEECDQFSILVGQAVALAKGERVRASQFRMIAAASLRDIVVKRGDVKEPMALEAGHQLAAQRKFVRKLRHGEAAQVAQHHEDVLIDRVHME